MEGYKHISLQERDEIAKLNAQGFSTHSIAERLGRSQPTISRELKRCVIQGRDYASSAAQVDRNIKASKKGRKKKLVEGNKLHSQVQSYLINQKWSREQISGYLKLHVSSEEYHISYESIYKYIYSIKVKEDREKWVQALRQKKKKRYRRKTNRLRVGKSNFNS
jgi:transposase, IS30 family